MDESQEHEKSFDNISAMDSIRNDISKMLPLNLNKQFLNEIEAEKADNNKANKKDPREIFSKQDEKALSIRSMNDLNSIQAFIKPNYLKGPQQSRYSKFDTNNASPKEEARSVWVNNKPRALRASTIQIDEEK